MRQHVGVSKKGRTDPYAAIIAAFSDLIDLVVQGEDLQVRGEEYGKSSTTTYTCFLGYCPG